MKSKVEKVKKKKGGAPVGLIVVLIIAAVGALVYFGVTKGFGFGSGTSGEPQSNASEESVLESKVESVTETFVEVTVSGSDYLYQNNKLTLDELIDKIKDTDMRVRITDESASLNAFKALTEKLDENGIKYINAE